MRKHQDHEYAALDFNTLCAIFTVDHIPGRIYFEALDVEDVHGIVHGMIGLYINTILVVPVTDRDKILSPHANFIPKRKADEQDRTNLENNWYWVQVRRGLHEGDVGLVVSPPSSTGTVKVNIVPRTAIPAPGSSSSLRDLRPNAPMRKKERPPQILRTQDDLKDIFGSDAIQEVESGFEFNGWSFTNDGFRIITLSLRDIVEYHPHIDLVSEFIDRCMTTEDDEHPLPSYHVPKFISPGNEVEIFQGSSDLKGQTARVHRHPAENKIDLLLESRGNDIVEVTVPSKDVRRVIRIGEKVVVKVGKFKGYTGFVCGAENRRLDVIDEFRTGFVSMFTCKKKKIN